MDQPASGGTWGKLGQHVPGISGKFERDIAPIGSANVQSRGARPTNEPTPTRTSPSWDPIASIGTRDDSLASASSGFESASWLSPRDAP